MKLQGLNRQQLQEATRVVSVLIQAYATDQSDIGRGYRNSIISGLAQTLDDLAETEQRAGRPVAQLIREFNRRHNPRNLRFSVVQAAAPFDVDEHSSSI
ncbi:MAG TPA: hypothetical protein PKD31_24875, partial [Blastocatellia bacterium]|nr:hypothetical protein [Blastocatellia bacterium]